MASGYEFVSLDITITPLRFDTNRGLKYRNSSTLPTISTEEIYTMAHGPATDWGEDKASEYKAKIGIYFFIFYSIIYSIFVVINVVRPITMAAIIFAGLNLAVVYGIGLIMLAIIMGLIYNYMCTKKENELHAEEEVQQ